MEVQKRSFLNIAFIACAICLIFTQLTWSNLSVDISLSDGSFSTKVLRGFGAFIFVSSILLSMKQKMKYESAAVKLMYAMISLSMAELFVAHYFLGQGVKSTYILNYLVLGIVALRSSASPGLLDKGLNILAIWLPIMNLSLLIISPSLVNRSAAQRILFLPYTQRFSGVFGDANVSGFFCCLILIWLHFEKPRFFKLTITINLICLILTESRIALIAYILGYIILKINLKYSRMLLNIVKMIGIGLSFLLVYTIYHLVTYQDNITNVLNMRSIIWQWSFKEIRKSPIAGIGLSNFQNDLHSSISIFWVHAHDQFLQDLIVGGFVRLALILLVYLVIYQKAKRMLFIGNALPLAFFCALLMESFFEVPLFLPTIDFRFFTAIFLIVVIFEKRNLIESEVLTQATDGSSQKLQAKRF